MALGLRLARGGARAGGRGRAVSGARRKRARGPEHGKEGPVTVRSSCQRPRLGSGRTEEKVRQTPVGCPTFRTQSRAEQPRLLVGRGGAAATSGRCLTWSPWSGWSCARACSLGYVLGQRAGGKTPQPSPPPPGHRCSSRGASARGDLPSHPGLGTGGAEEPVRAASAPAAGSGSAGSGRARAGWAQGPGGTCPARAVGCCPRGNLPGGG